MIRFVAGVLLVAAFGACGTERRAAPAAHGAVDTTHATLLLEILATTTGGNLQLEYPVGATRLADGTVVVADGIAPAVRFFDAGGRLVRSVGRAGEGPGEFGMLSWLGRCGEGTVAVWDFMLMRLTRIDIAGSVTEQRSLREPRPPARVSCSRTGALALLARPDLQAAGGRTGFVSLAAPLTLLDADSSVVRLADSAVVTEWAVDAGQFRPLSPTTYTAMSGSWIYVGSSHSDAIDVYDHAGALRSTVLIQVVDRAPTNAHVERAVEEQTIWIADGDLRARMYRRQVGIPRVERLPHYSGVYVDSSETVWLVRSFPGDSITRLDGYRMDGTIIGHVSVASDLRVLEVGTDYVIGATTGYDIRVYAFDR